MATSHKSSCTEHERKHERQEALNATTTCEKTARAYNQTRIENIRKTAEHITEQEQPNEESKK